MQERAIRQRCARCRPPTHKRALFAHIGAGASRSGVDCSGLTKHRPPPRGDTTTESISSPRKYREGCLSQGSHSICQHPRRHCGIGRHTHNAGHSTPTSSFPARARDTVPASVENAPRRKSANPARSGTSARTTHYPPVNRSGSGAERPRRTEDTYDNPELLDAVRSAVYPAPKLTDFRNEMNRCDSPRPSIRRGLSSPESGLPPDPTTVVSYFKPTYFDHPHAMTQKTGCGICTSLLDVKRASKTSSASSA